MVAEHSAVDAFAPEKYVSSTGGPSWFRDGMKDAGTYERLKSGGSNPVVQGYLADVTPAGETPPRNTTATAWCAAWIGAKLKKAKLPYNRSFLASSYMKWGYALKKPRIGCVVVFWRNSPSSIFGHIGFFVKEDATHVWVLGGNQRDSVNVTRFAKKGARFGLRPNGYRWHAAMDGGSIPDTPAPSRAYVSPVQDRAFSSIAPEVAHLWKTMTVTDAAFADKQARAILANKARYKAVTAKTNVPWWFVGALHMRESGFDFTTHLHNGDPLTRRTTRVPAGRPSFGAPPYAWVASACDALWLKSLHKIRVWSVERAAFEAERYNGFGYRNRGKFSEYVWGKTGHNPCGKFVRDGVYDARAVSQQIGVMPVLKRLSELDPSFALPLETQDFASVPETVARSKSLRTAITGFFAGVLAWFASQFQALWDGILWLFGIVPEVTQQATGPITSTQTVAQWLNVPWSSVGVAVCIACLLVVFFREIEQKRARS